MKRSMRRGVLRAAVLGVALAASPAAGGKVVWRGIPPLLFPNDPASGMPDLLHVGRDAARELLGVSFANANFDLVNATPAGPGTSIAGRSRAGTRTRSR